MYEVRIGSPLDDSLPEEDISYEWCSTPCVKSGLKEVNEFIRSAPCARCRIDPVVRQLSIPWKEAAPSTQRYYCPGLPCSRASNRITFRVDETYGEKREAK